MPRSLIACRSGQEPLKRIRHFHPNLADRCHQVCVGMQPKSLLLKASFLDCRDRHEQINMMHRTNKSGVFHDPTAFIAPVLWHLIDWQAADIPCSEFAALHNCKAQAGVQSSNRCRFAHDPAHSPLKVFPLKRLHQRLKHSPSGSMYGSRLAE